MPIVTSSTGQLSYDKINKSLCIFGRYRSGKTWFITTCPKPHVICTEQGLLGLADSGYDIPFTKVDTWEELTKVVNDFKIGKNKGIKTLVLDDLSTITDMIYRSIVGEDRVRSLRRQEWPGAVDKLRMVIYNFLDCQRHYNVVLLARAKLKDIEDPDKPETAQTSTKSLELPDTIGQFATVVGGMFDFCFYSEYRETYDPAIKSKRPAPVFISVPNGRYQVGHRTAPGRFPREMPNDWNEFIKHLTKPYQWVHPNPAPLDSVKPKQLDQKTSS